MPCTVANFVRERIAKLEEEASVVEGGRLMEARDVGSVVVTRGGEVVGIFTEQDMTRRIINRNLDPETTTVGEACTSHLVTIAADASCQEAIMKMRANGCHRLFVYRGAQFLGLVKLHDIANGLAVQGKRQNWFPNLIVGLTLILVSVVVVLLAIQLPDVLSLIRSTND
jgi:signal-transduction protein with cAMP-binding, CBS, and nucleotidyltransferase domain